MQEDQKIRTETNEDISNQFVSEKEFYIILYVLMSCEFHFDKIPLIKQEMLTV